MIISHKRKFIFVRNPKCASSSMNAVLKHFHDHSVKYKTHDALNHLDFDYGSYFSAIFVRNPWDRTISYYKYVCRSTVHRHHQQLKEQGFERYVMDPGKALLAPCYKRAKGVKWVGKVENIKKDWQTLCGMINVGILKLPTINVSKKTKHFHYYYTSQKLLDKVADHYAEDIRLYDYEVPAYDVVSE